MATTAGKLATELGIKPEQVLQACRQAGVTAFGEQTPLDDREAARIQAVLRVPPQQWPVPGTASDAAPPGHGPLPGPPMPRPLPPPPASAGGGGKTVPVWLVVVLTVVVALAVVGVAGTVLGGDDESNGIEYVTEEDLRETPPTTADVVSDPFPTLRGQCWTDPARPDLLAEPEPTQSAVDIVNCSQPHQGEVYEVLFHPSGDDDPYPGNDALAEHAFNQCGIRFQGFVGRPLQESTLDVYVAYPTERGWLLGDRVIVCSVYALDGSMLTGTAEASAR